jgi:arginine exporter protein ArgO
VSALRDRVFVLLGLGSVAVSLAGQDAPTIDDAMPYVGISFLLWLGCFIIWGIEQTEQDSAPPGGAGHA